MVKPPRDQRPSRVISFSKQCSHGGIGERLIVGFGQVKNRLSEGLTRKAVGSDEGYGES